VPGHAAETYAARIDAVRAQRARFEQPGAATDRWASRASFFRLDPKRELDANSAAILSLIEPDDSVVDIGGGAGRLALPAAMRSAEVVNVEPSPAMREQFAASAAEAGIANARCVDAAWPEGSESLAAGVVLTANVTYFVRDIRAFVEAMDRAARRLCAITVWSVPPPDRASAIFELVTGEPLELTPTHLDLLAVLWEMGILPDIRVLPDDFRAFATAFDTREAAVQNALEAGSPTRSEEARARIEANFDRLFVPEGAGYRATWARTDSREMLITWAPVRGGAHGG
jgi:SAM-dependent methyltransferase